MSISRYRRYLAASRKGVTIKIASRNLLESLPGVFVIQPDTSAYLAFAKDVTPAQRMDESWTRTGNQMASIIKSSPET